ncbi:PREDICTED: N-acetyltransferase 6 [Cyprinodon variegatus]|uniref:N-acetyltransferase 6 n=1 Tax=Cyprinodon variegatus TaxID=28743 RepID=UPI0007428A11|nr:PREDICTED: N-acetyltransferase 6 [Cyprinodon variegatus]
MGEELLLQLLLLHFRAQTDPNPDHRRSEALTSSSCGPVSRDPLDGDPLSFPNSHNAEKVIVLHGDDQENKHPDAEDPGRIHVVPIHHRLDLLVPCADLVNSEWQRSQAARVHSLQKSCSEFPVCLILLTGSRGPQERLLGHARLSRVVGHSSSLFVESVVVSKQERGKGYGRILMEETELYAKRRGFKRLCLTTHDKQHFYAHLGYVLSTPVQSAGAVMALLPEGMLQRLSRAANKETNPGGQTLTKIENSEGAPVLGSPPPSSLQLPPPPPPPSSIPTPPPPPPLLSAGQPLVQTLTETPYRDARGAPIFWMHKDI